MTAEIELLPLPEGEASSFGDYEVHDNGTMVAYARANVAHAVAPLQAEIEALRETLTTLKAENERLREVLQVLINWTPSADTYRRMGFNPEAPMRAHDAAKALLGKEDRND